MGLCMCLFVETFLVLQNLCFSIHFQALKNYRGPKQLETIQDRHQGAPAALMAQGRRMGKGVIWPERFRQRSGRGAAGRTWAPGLHGGVGRPLPEGKSHQIACAGR